jgi:hypothetical protein
MKRVILFATSAAVLFCLSGLPLLAQSRSGGGMGQGQGPGTEPGQTGQNDPTARQPTMGEPGADGTNTNQTMPKMKTPDQLLSQNPKLSDKVQTLLPDGTKVQDAATGFKELGDFVAAVHISKNLNIPFEQFKNKVTSGDSLGKALKELNPTMDHKEIKSEVKKGKQQAKEDIKASHQS